MTDTMPEFIAKERDRLTKAREDLVKKRQDIDAELAGIDREMHAIAAYETARAGKPPTKTGGSRPQISMRHTVLTIIKNNPAITRGQLIERMGIKGDKAREGSLSNTLGIMKKAGTLTSADGKYTAA